MRDNLFKVARLKNKVDDWGNYRTARNKAVGMLRGAKRDFYHTSFEENKNNPRAIWKLIKSLTFSDKVKNNANKLKIGDSIIEDKGQITDKFNKHFSTIADKLRSTLQQLSFDRSKLVDFVWSKKNQKVSYCIPSITSDQVLNILSKISLRKAAGVDEIYCSCARGVLGLQKKKKKDNE